MNIDEKVPDDDLTWERELVSTMLHECVGDNVALESLTWLTVTCGKVYLLGQVKLILSSTGSQLMTRDDWQLVLARCFSHGLSFFIVILFVIISVKCKHNKSMIDINIISNILNKKGNKCSERATIGPPNIFRARFVPLYCKGLKEAIQKRLMSFLRFRKF